MVFLLLALAAAIGVLAFGLVVAFREVVADGLSASWIALFAVFCVTMLAIGPVVTRISRRYDNAATRRLRYASEGTSSEFMSQLLVVVVLGGLVLEWILPGDVIFLIGLAAGIALLLLEFLWRLVRGPGPGRLDA